MVTGQPPALAATSVMLAAVTRRARLGAAALDLLALLPPLAAAAAIAVAWLLVRTAWGRDDPASLDGSIALAVLCAAPAAWLGRLGAALAATGATPGHRARRLRVEAAGTRLARTPARARVLRLALHPFGAAAWGLAGLVLLLLGAWPAAAAAGVVVLGVLAGGLVSLAMILAAPDARALHDRIAGTRVVRL